MMNDEFANSSFIILFLTINILLKHISFFGVIFESTMEQAQTNKMIPNSIKASPLHKIDFYFISNWFSA
ncbi:MAG: hypothetical protein RIS64_1366 [Bacteroidota bacterium]|jgi:hypothetical protein